MSKLTTIASALILVIPACAAPTGKTEEGKKDEKAAAEIKALIPQASSNPIKEWRELGEPGKTPAPEDIKNHSLSMALMTLRATDAKNDAARKEFRLIGDGTVNPADLAKAITKSEAKGYGTLLQPEYITDFTCNVKGDEATGVVSYRAEKLYEGRAEYTARRKDGKWRVEEFRMPGYQIKIALQADGTWKRSKTGKEE